MKRILFLQQSAKMEHPGGNDGFHLSVLFATGNGTSDSFGSIYLGVFCSKSERDKEDLFFATDGSYGDFGRNGGNTF